MTLFIETAHGHFVNAAHIARIIPCRVTVPEKRRGEDVDSLSHYELLMCNDAGGGTFRAHTWKVPVELLQRTIVPAAAGAKALQVGYDSWTDTEPGPDDIWVDWAPVVAWSIRPEARDELGADPVFAEAPASNVTVFLEMPDGRFSLPFDSEYPDIDAVKAEMLERARKVWHERHDAAPTQEPPA